LHFHLIEYGSCDGSMFLSTESACWRIDRSALIIACCVGSIGSAPSVEVCRLTCAIFAPTDAEDMLSCSPEHIDPLNAVEIKISKVKAPRPARRLREYAGDFKEP
jgi:hypothetical protein